jgi:hypothetical protein
MPSTYDHAVAFSAEERAREQKAAQTEADVLAKIAELSEPDRSLAARIHELVKADEARISALAKRAAR